MSARAVFAAVLASYRKQAGLTQAEAAARFQMSKSLYQKIELCDRKPQRELAMACDEAFGTPGAFLTIYQDMITEPYPAWFGPRVTYEDRAAVITVWEQGGVPGLLQTEDYARAVIRACRPYDPPAALEHSVRSRLERQDILSRENAPGADGPATMFEFADEQPVAYLEGWGSGRVVGEPREVAAIATALSMIKGCALSPGDSRLLMAEIRS